MPVIPTSTYFYYLSCAILLTLLASSFALTGYIYLQYKNKKFIDADNEASFKLLANTLPQLAHMADETGWIFWYNDRWYEYTGLTKRQMEGWGWAAVHDQKLLPVVIEKWKNSIATGKPFEMVFPLKAADGSFHPFLARSNPILDTNGKLIYWFGTNTDITEQVKAETNAREAFEREESERVKLLALIENAPYFIGLADLDGTLQYHNHAARTLLGFSENEDLTKYKIEDMLPNWAKIIFEDTIIPQIQATGIWQGELALRHQDGHEIPVSQLIALYRDKNDIPICITTIVQDITERHLQQQALKNSEETFRLAMEAASIGMALVKPDGSWIKVNPALQELLGYSYEELIATDFQSITYPDDLAEDMKFVTQILSGKISHYKMEKRYIHKNGQLIWVLLSVSLMRDNNGEPKYFISQIQDITEQKEIQTIKDEFISTVSHELRTPLTSIRGALILLLDSLNDLSTEEAKSLLDIASNNCERLIILINDILDIDKIASGKMRFDIKATPLAKITQEGVNANKAYAEKFNIQLALEPLSAEIKIYVDENRYVQILSNLLSNAAKFSNPGDTVIVRTELKEKMVRISVIDKGSGIPEEFRKHIFCKFSQADSSATRAKSGTGLGLHITQQIVKAMHGNIGYESKVGQGSTFWVEFPVVLA